MLDWNVDPRTFRQLDRTLVYHKLWKVRWYGHYIPNKRQSNKIVKENEEIFTIEKVKKEKEKKEKKSLS